VKARPDPVALVTGGGGGIGRACALALAARGYRVAIFDLKTGHIRSRRGERLTILTCDITDDAQVRRSLRVIVGDLGRIDAVVNCAGIMREERVGEIQRTTIEQVIGTNLVGTMNVCLAAIPALRRAQGAIVNISSAQAHRPSPGLAIYAATKGGVEAFTKALALELAPAGVRVNAVSPGLVETQILHDHVGVTAATYRNYVRRRGRGYLLGRIGKVSEVAEMVAFLASPAAAWITGAVVPVDGGKSVGGG
jgi:NAD(P)-dependent dehydrogenase (short-subunit alcohol dehydrogenase family)